MAELDKYLVDYIKKQVIEDANGRERRELKYWIDGINNEIPVEYTSYAVQFERNRDPEYKRYLELKKRYESNN